MMVHAVFAVLAVLFSTHDVTHGIKMDERVVNKTTACSNKYMAWKLRSLVFYPHLARVQTEKIPLREVKLTTATKSSVEIEITDQFEGYSRYAYHNGTVVYDKIRDLGQVPRIVNGKVTTSMMTSKGGYLYAKKKFKKNINSKFTCHSSTERNYSVRCKVILNQNRYQVPFTAFLQSKTGFYICTSYGLWEKLDDPVPELTTELEWFKN